MRFDGREGRRRGKGKKEEEKKEGREVVKWEKNEGVDQVWLGSKRMWEQDQEELKLKKKKEKERKGKIGENAEERGEERRREGEKERRREGEKEKERE